MPMGFPEIGQRIRTISPQMVQHLSEKAPETRGVCHHLTHPQLSDSKAKTTRITHPSKPSLKAKAENQTCFLFELNCQEKRRPSPSLPLKTSMAPPIAHCATPPARGDNVAPLALSFTPAAAAREVALDLQDCDRSSPSRGAVVQRSTGESLTAIGQRIFRLSLFWLKSRVFH